MQTPICDFIRNYVENDITRFHMPGHKGTGFLGCEHLDITEVSGADDLFCPNGIILQSEKNASKLFQSRHTFYSVGGSSQSIKAMLYLAKMLSETTKNGQACQSKIVAMRASHKSFFHGCALLGIQPVFINTSAEKTYYSSIIHAQELEKTLVEMREKPIGVFITTIDYLGNASNVKELSDVCKHHNIPLLADNAHGAYLQFMKNEEYAHPLKLGADLCCDSAHKTLPVITGGAYLHVNKQTIFSFENYARNALSYFGSTSPSYLVLQSLDMCNKKLFDGYDREINNCALALDNLKNSLGAINIHAEKSDPLRLVINAENIGYSGEELLMLLREFKVEPEYADKTYVVFMVTPNNKGDDFERLYTFFKKLQIKKSFVKKPFFKNYNEYDLVLSPRSAMMQPSEKLPVDKCLGKICAQVSVSCPPAVPIVICGEKITQKAIDTLIYYNVKYLDVVAD